MAPLFLPGRGSDDSSPRKKTRQGNPYRVDLISNVSDRDYFFAFLSAAVALA